MLSKREKGGIHKFKDQFQGTLGQFGSIGNEKE